MPLGNAVTGKTEKNRVKSMGRKDGVGQAKEGTRRLMEIV